MAATSSIAAPAEVEPLFRPFKVGSYELTNRMVYPPLTRCRAVGTVPQPIMVQYYEQRARPGTLIIAEGTIVDSDGHGYPQTPGLYTSTQVEGWKPIVKAVKGKGATFFAQIWHCGRASHPAYQQPGGQVVSSSAVPIDSPAFKMVWTGSAMEPYPVPQPLDKEGIKAKVEAFRVAARNAVDAGFDGVEIHAANGYLIDQFTKDGVNKRTDEYGGSVENRCRFALEVVQAVVDEIGCGKVGIRLSPFTDFLDAVDSTPATTYVYLIEQLNKFGLAYLHMVEPRVQGNEDVEKCEGSLELFRKAFKGPFIAAGGYKRDTGAAAIESGHADLIAFGRDWLANPDMQERFLKGAALNKYNRDTFYSAGSEGYIDYPSLEEATA